MYQFLQVATMVPVNALLIFRILKRKDYSQYEVREKYESYWEAFNIFHINPYSSAKKKLEQEKGKIKKNDDEKTINKPYLETDFWDHVYRLFLFICILYYVVDTLIKIAEMSLPDYQDSCKIGFLVHHIITVLGFKSIFFACHYPWFLMGPMSFHTVVVGLPHLGLFNNCVYLFFVASWVYNITKSPFWSKRIYKVCFYTAIILLFPLAFLAWGNCM